MYEGVPKLGFCSFCNTVQCFSVCDVLKWRRSLDVVTSKISDSHFAPEGPTPHPSPATANWANYPRLKGPFFFHLPRPLPSPQAPWCRTYTNNSDLPREVLTILPFTTHIKCAVTHIFMSHLRRLPFPYGSRRALPPCTSAESCLSRWLYCVVLPVAADNLSGSVLPSFLPKGRSRCCVSGHREVAPSRCPPRSGLHDRGKVRNESPVPGQNETPKGRGRGEFRGSGTE